MYIHTKELTQYTEQDIRALYPNTAFPHPFVAPAEYAYIFPAPSNHDPETEVAVPAAPALTIKGNYEQRWHVSSLPDEVLAARKAEADRQHNTAVQAQLQALDLRRIRPLAEGDIAFLTMLNDQITALRATLRK